jgi:ADP-heptose:LPS heptosyltransferase
MKILVIRLSSIGDIVLTSPVIRCLAAQKGANVHFLTKSAFSAIPAANPMIQKVFALGSSSNTNEKVVVGDNLSIVIQLLRAEQYDYIIDLHHNLRSLRVKLALRVSAFSFDKLNFKKWVLVNFGKNILPNRHIVHRYMDTVSALGVQYDGNGLDFHLPAALDDSKINDFTNSWCNQSFVAFVLGATHATKRLPISKVIEICKEISIPVVLIGGPDEKVTGDNIVHALRTQIYNACGQFSLFESALLVQRAQVVITHDTGMMHIAAAFRKPIVSIWGSTVPAFGMYPFYPDGIDLNTTVEVAGLSCRPCSKIGFATCPKGHFACMNLVETSQVLSKIDQ